MKFTDDRYAAERSQFELALRMIGHEARTGTITACTGLSDDRIRKLYSRYFCTSGGSTIKRRRGKSPRQVANFVGSAAQQLESTTLLALFCANLLLRIDADRRVFPSWPRPDVDYGHRVCRAYETYLSLHAAPKLSFEQAWSLLSNISHNDELFLSVCQDCDAPYVQDAYALDQAQCPGCVIGGAPRRSGGQLARVP